MKAARRGGFFIVVNKKSRPFERLLGQHYVIGLVSLSRSVVGVEQFMGFVPEGFAKKIFVDLFDFGVLVRFADGHSHVFLVDRFFSLGADIAVGRDRLAAAAKATARAGHDLDEMVVRLAVPD